MPKDKKKKICEKERRDHLKEAFIKLEKLLPSYDPSSPATRIDILTKSIEYIQEMKDIIQELSKPHSEMNPKVLKLKNLQDRIKRLVSRMEILSRLLREAKIPIPNCRSLRDSNHRNYRWIRKINEKKVLGHKNILEKRNQIDDNENLNIQNTVKKKTSKLNSPILEPKHHKNIKSVRNEISAKPKPLHPATSNCLIIYTQGYNTSPCYLVTNAPSSTLPGSSQTVITNSYVASHPVMATNIRGSKKALSESNSKMQTLGSGTLILANGSIYPVLPQPQPILQTPMLLQVTNNSNAMMIKSESKQIEKNENVESKATKRTVKKSLSEKSKNNLTNSCNIVKTNSISQLCIKPDHNVHPSKSHLMQLVAPMNKLPISPSNVLKPRILLPAVNRKIVGKRIGNKPVSREALKRIGKLTKKKEMKLKLENSSTITKNHTQDILPKKDSSEIVISEVDLGSNVNSVEMKKDHNTEDAAKSQSSNAQKTISIISDNIVRASDHDNESGFEINSKHNPTSAAVIENENLIINKKKNNPLIDVPKIEETRNYVKENSSADKDASQSSMTKSKTSQHSDIPLAVSEKPTEHNQISDDSQKDKLTEILNKNEDKSERADGVPLNQVPNDEHNIRTESNLDLENVCNMNQQLKNLDIHLEHSELSNDIFASLQVPPGCQNPESTSPTAAFLLAFPLVSSLTGVKVAEVMNEDNPDSQRETPTLLQIGTMDTSKSAQSESFNPNLLNLDFFSSKDIYGGFYNSFEQHLSSLTMLPSSNLNDSLKITEKTSSSSKFGDNFKSSNILDTIQVSSTTNNISSNEHTKSTTGIQNNSIYSSTQTECQPHFSFENGKQSNSVSATEGNKNNISSSLSYLNKSTIQQNLDRETHSTSENQNVHAEKSTKTTEEVKLSFPEIPMTNNFTKDTKTKVESSPKNITDKTDNSFMKRETCENLFNIENINNNLTSGHKCMEQVNNINFYPEKQKSLISENFHGQNSGAKNNIQPLFQENILNTQIPFTATKNFEATSIQSNQINSANYNPLNQQVSSSKSLIQPYYISDNKNYQSIPNQNNMKPFNMDIRNTQTQKYFNYNNVDSENKKSLKNNQMNFDFNVEKKVSSFPRIMESKELTSNSNMAYSSTIYDINNITRVCTCAYSSNKPPCEPLYTNSNHNNYNYYSNSENYLGDTSYKNVKNDKNPITSNLEPYSNYKRADFNNTCYPDNMRKSNITFSKSENISEKSTYNWMTTPTKSTLDHSISNFTKADVIHSSANQISNNQPSYFNTTSMYSNELNTTSNQISKKTFDLPLVNMNYQKPEMDEAQNQFTWSPTKMPQFLDSVPSFVSSTLPTLVGDLALGSSNFTDQKYEFSNKCAKDTKHKNNTKISYENQNNFFSVSQLVHQHDKTGPAKTTRRRNSGSASKNIQIKNKKLSKHTEEQKDVSHCFNKSSGSQSNSKIENKGYNYKNASNNAFCDKRSPLKVSSSIYSAEALIGHQGNSENTSKKDQGYSGNHMKNIPVPPYIPDNIMPYFPPVDLQQENIIQQNQNYQNFPNFTTFPNNTYSTNTFIPSSTITTPYINSSTFVPDLGVGNEFSSENISLFSNSSMNKIKIPSKTSSGQREEKNIHSGLCPNIALKKVKKKSFNDFNVTSNLVDFPFLSVPGSINSPLLPDDFHSHSTFLPPPPTQSQLYPCKNTLYTPKQNTITSTAPLLPLPPIPSVSKSGIQHPEISPSLNSVGTSLTNFNLSTIFPEITKNSMADIYSENQNKEQNANRDYPNPTIPFNSKQSFTYPNCPVTQSYGIDNR